MSEANAKSDIKTFGGKLDASGLRFGVVLARFNAFFGDRLLEGALEGLERTGASTANITVAKVPGAWELPIVAQRMAESKRYDAIIALGVVIRGHTPHFDFVAGEASKGLATVMLKHDVPVVNGLITADTLDQAVERAGSKAGNKGYDAALTAVEMASLLKTLGAK
jgi:6,7-dimethyl-8-ribityllumazine synthase